jgi:hypothetical protein
MNFPLWAGCAAFFAVPFVLWMIATASVARQGFQERAFALIAGDDGRLSLARLQALSWTLVIFGAFVAAMLVRDRITTGSPEEIGRAHDVAKAAAEKALAARTALEKALSDSIAAQTAETATALAARLADAYTARAQAAGLPAGEIAEAGKKAALAHATAVVAAADRARLSAATLPARLALARAEGEARTATATASSYKWVGIPSELLLLAGIAIGSGVFSTLISSVRSEEKTARLESAQLAPVAGTNPPLHQLTIRGNNLGGSGSVRVNGRHAAVKEWTDVQILAYLPDGARTELLIVDTSHGKVSHQLTGTGTALSLGPPRTRYEFSDLFRDDKNPIGLSLMKFQMFGWTVVAITLYAWFFLDNLSDHLMVLPTVDSSIALLTGVSQTGYLADKAVSGVKPGP